MAENAHSTPAPKISALPQNREDVEHLVEDLIAWLDDQDGDENLEPYLAGLDGSPTDDREGGDILDLPHDADADVDVSWPESGPRAFGMHCLEDDEDGADDEPNLGAPEQFYASTPYWGGNMRKETTYDPAMPVGSQTSWARGHGDDIEAVDEDGDPLDAAESDGLEHGEADPAESDGGGHISGGGYRL